MVSHEERGRRTLDVMNARTQESVYSFDSDNEEDGQYWLIENGFMKHGKDNKGLCEYLVSIDMLPKNAVLITESEAIHNDIF
jgi:hypothetical protein